MSGILADGSVAKTRQANQVVGFRGDGFMVDPTSMTLTTAKGIYTLVKHPTRNILTAVCKGTKVRITLKKTVGRLQAWY